MAAYAARRVLAADPGPAVRVVRHVHAHPARARATRCSSSWAAGASARSSSQALRQQFGLDGDPVTQYVAWIGRVLQGDLGESYKLKQDVSDLILARLPVTLELILFSVILAVAVAIPLGVYQARRRDTCGDYAGSLFALVAVSSPVYFTAILASSCSPSGWECCQRSGGAGPICSIRLATCCCRP